MPCNPSTWEVGTGKSEVQSHCQLCNKYDTTWPTVLKHSKMDQQQQQQNLKHGKEKHSGAFETMLILCWMHIYIQMKWLSRQKALIMEAR